MDKLNLKRKNGFTLIEIVIVAVVAGIVAVNIMPKFQELIVESKTSTYEANLAAVDTNFNTSKAAKATKDPANPYDTLKDLASKSNITSSKTPSDTVSDSDLIFNGNTVPYYQYNLQSRPMFIFMASATNTSTLTSGAYVLSGTNYVIDKTLNTKVARTNGGSCIDCSPDPTFATISSNTTLASSGSLNAFKCDSTSFSKNSWINIGKDSSVSGFIMPSGWLLGVRSMTVMKGSEIKTLFNSYMNYGTNKTSNQSANATTLLSRINTRYVDDTKYCVDFGINSNNAVAQLPVNGTWYEFRFAIYGLDASSPTTTPYINGSGYLPLAVDYSGICLGIGKKVKTWKNENYTSPTTAPSDIVKSVDKVITDDATNCPSSLGSILK